ncbi:hypothetical protein [Microcoleus sp. F4-D5]
MTTISFFTQGTVTAQIGKVHLAINKQYGGKESHHKLFLGLTHP